MNPQIDNYLTNGCGRCPLVGTPQCKVHSWQPELHLLRQILLASGLTEELKWSMPCYTYSQHNIVLMSAFKEYCALSFFKGALLADRAGILEKPGEHTQAARVIRFTSVAEITAKETLIKAYIQEAIAVEKAGLKVESKAYENLQIPVELQHKFNDDPLLEIAFNALTPGRQRGYILHIAGAKQPKTRFARIEKCVQKILDGKGVFDY